MRLLNTRPKEDAVSLTLALEAMGHQVIPAPLLHIEDVDTPLPDLEGLGGLLATSANGVRAFARRSDRRNLKVYAVGDATAACATAEGFTQVFTASGDVQALAQLVMSECKPADGPLLHIAGSKVAGDLSGELTAVGYDVQRCVLYRAVTAHELPEAIKNGLVTGDVDGVLLYSPRTAATLIDLVQKAGLEKACGTADVWCLSAAVSDKARDLDWRNIYTAPHPEQAALLALMADLAGGEI